jgi:hypothetical protein
VAADSRLVEFSFTVDCRFFYFLIFSAQNLRDKFF